MKIGIYGGSFNPPHKFHKEIIKYLLDNRYLDKVIIVPTGDSYKKRDLAPFINRFEMLTIVFDGIAEISAIGNEGYDYTYQVMDYYKEKYPDSELYFIMGEDNYSELSTWKKYEYLISNYKFMVVDRNNLNLKDEDYITRVTGLKASSMSSSVIRDEIKNGNSVIEYLDKDIIKYIATYNLYNFKNYKNEEEFLKDYDSSIYPRFAIATDILVFGVSSNDVDDYRKLDNKKMSVLLIKRNDYPFKDRWCLPGGFVYSNENLEDSPRRVLKNETGLDKIYLEQLYTFGAVDRDPRMRVISSAYMALVDKDKITEIKNDGSWFDITSVDYTKDKIKMKLSNGKDNIDFTIKRRLREYTTDRYEFEVEEDKYLSFDNPLVITAGLERLKNKLLYTDIVFNMMPELFTLGELQKVYEVILGKKLLDPAFRRMIKDKVEETEEYKTGEGHRPSKLFKYKYKK